MHMRNPVRCSPRHSLRHPKPDHVVGKLLKKLANLLPGCLHSSSWQSWQHFAPDIRQGRDLQKGVCLFARSG